VSKCPVTTVKWGAAMPKWSFTRIRQRVLVLFVTIVVVLTLFVVTTTGILTRALVNDLVEERALDLVQHQNQVIGLWLEERITELEQLAHSSLLESLDWDEIEPHLQRRIAQSENYYLIFFVASPDGEYNTTSMRNAGNISDRDYFPRVFAGETVVSEPLVSRSTDQRIIVVATPIYTADGSEIAGLLGLSVDLVAMLQDAVHLAGERSDMNVYLVDGEGHFILHDNPDLILHGRMQNVFSDWDDFAGQKSGSFTVSEDGQSYRVFFQELAGITDWNVIVRVPTAFFDQPVLDLIYRLMAVCIIGILLVVWLGSWFASTISRPIVELNDIFKQGAQGDLTVRAEIDSTDELGETSASFNKMMDRIGTMTYYDPLTGLPNRQHFLDLLEKSLADDTTVIFALISIRDFSELKTLAGPDVTDRVLKYLAETLQKLSDESLIMGRLADAEFGLIISSGSSRVLKTIDRLDNLLAHPLHYEIHDLNVNLLGGISISEDPELTADEFFHQAQTALYEAEHSTDDRLRLYNSDTHRAMIDRLRFQAEIRTGLDEDQFIAFYQPVVDLKTNIIVGKEALIRWQHPEKGLLTPNQFLSIAEQGGFIEEIGKYMLAKVCAQHQAWLAQGIDLGWVAVNISANHFRSREFPGLIRNILHTYGLPASILRIEITEEAMLAPTHDVLHNLEELKKMGVLLAIDDFGTAYSSLEYLVRYPVETLKIDRTFIDQVDINARAQGLVRSIVGMGRNLAMCVVAEGVERKNQLHILRTMQCNEAQGFLFSRPLPPDDYVQVADHLAEQLENSKMVL